MSDNVNRRDFLTTGAIAAGTLAFSSNLFAQSSGDIKIGVIGCGGRGSGAIKNVLDADKDVKIAALCDLVENTVKGRFTDLKKRHADRLTATEDVCFHGLDGYKKLLEMKDINYVILATPPGFRPYHLEA